jgi:hypothetical protein
MRLDLPTLERPMKAYSGFVSSGHMLTIGALRVNSAVFISISFLFFRCKGTKKNRNSLAVSEIIITFAVDFPNQRFRSCTMQAFLETIT